MGNGKAIVDQLETSSGSVIDLQSTVGIENRTLGVGASRYAGTAKSEIGQYVQNGDVIPVGTTHLAVIINGEVETVAMSPVASGAVSLLTETSATIGGVSVTFSTTVEEFNTVESMVANAVRTAIGIYSTGDTVWKFIDETAPIDDNNFRALGAVSVADFGIVGNYFLGDGSINPTPTDDYQKFIDIFSNVSSQRGIHLYIPSGFHMYMSQSINIEYTSGNFFTWLTSTRNYGQIRIEGAGIGSCGFYFPSTVVDGLTFNKSNAITNIKASGFRIHREGFNPDDYLARNLDDDLDLSGEPLFGAGLWAQKTGYTGGFDDIDISGFYIGLYGINNYNGMFSRIFTKDTIYGYYGNGNTSCSFKDCDFGGLQACWASLDGSNSMENIVAEGLTSVFDRDNNLDYYGTKFFGHAYLQRGGRFIGVGNVYSESVPGFSRGMYNVLYIEHGGRATNNIRFAYNNDVISQGFKDKLDIYNPQLISIKFERSGSGTLRAGKMSNTRIDTGDRIQIIDQLSTDFAFSNVLDIIDCIPVNVNYITTVSDVFTNKVPTNLKLIGTGSNNSIPDSYSGPTRFNGPVWSISDFSATFAPVSGVVIGRLTSAGNTEARNAVEMGIETGGRLRYTYKQYNASGVETTSDIIGYLGVDGRLTTGDIRPMSDNAYDIGIGSARFADAYFVNNPTIGSDERIKKDISSIPQELCDFVMSTEIRQYKLKDGQSGRNHFGIIITEDFLDKLNLIYSVDDCAALCRTVFTDEQGEPIDIEIGGVILGSLWQVRYAEWQNILLEALRRKLLQVTS